MAGCRITVRTVADYADWVQWNAQAGDTLVSGDAGDQYAGLDRFGRVVDQLWSISGVHSQTERFKYGYDRDGNVLYENNIEDPALSELFHANSTSPGDDNTAYDNLNRIVAFERGTLSASGNNGTTLDTVTTPNTNIAGSTQSWNLDSIGNANSITTDGTQQNRTFNSQNEATTVGSSTLTYDNNGNTTTDDQGHTLVYDAWNRLVAVKSGGTTLASYTYDANGNRISQTEGGATTNLYYSSAGQVIEERQGSTVTDQNVWGLGYVNDMVLRDDNSTTGSFGMSGSGLGERMFIQQDANWNVIALSPSYGGIAEEFTYSPYGVRTALAAGGTPTTDGYNMAYGFQGMRYDAVTGMLHANVRDYSPTLERWVQKDAGYWDGMDLYQSDVDNPLRETDPFGQTVKIDGGVGTDTTDGRAYYEAIRAALQSIVGGCAQLHLKYRYSRPHYHWALPYPNAVPGFLGQLGFFQSRYITSAMLTYSNENPNCKCSGCWQDLKGLIDSKIQQGTINNTNPFFKEDNATTVPNGTSFDVYIAPPWMYSSLEW